MNPFFGSIANEQVSLEYDANNMLIPNKTKALAMIDEAKWSEYNGSSFIALRWTISKPEEYSNRKVFKKLHFSDPSKKDNALRFLAAVDANCGGKIMALGRTPTDADLQVSLMNKLMVINISQWVIDKDEKKQPLPPEEIKRGNTVDAVSPYKREGAAPGPTPVAQPTPQQPTSGDDIPW